MRRFLIGKKYLCGEILTTTLLCRLPPSTITRKFLPPKDKSADGVTNRSSELNLEHDHVKEPVNNMSGATHARTPQELRPSFRSRMVTPDFLPHAQSREAIMLILQLLRYAFVGFPPPFCVHQCIGFEVLVSNDWLKQKLSVAGKT